MIRYESNENQPCDRFFQQPSLPIENIAPFSISLYCQSYGCSSFSFLLFVHSCTPCCCFWIKFCYLVFYCRFYVPGGADLMLLLLLLSCNQPQLLFAYHFLFFFAPSSDPHAYRPSQFQRLYIMKLYRHTIVKKIKT